MKVLYFSSDPFLRISYRPELGHVFDIHNWLLVGAKNIAQINYGWLPSKVRVEDLLKKLAHLLTFLFDALELILTNF